MFWTFRNGFSSYERQQKNSRLHTQLPTYASIIVKKKALQNGIVPICHALIFRELRSHHSASYQFILKNMQI